MSGIFTKCSSGGTCLSVEYTDKVGELAKKHGLKLHIDGARIFNASVVSKSFSICYFCHCILLCGKFLTFTWKLVSTLHTEKSNCK